MNQRRKGNNLCFWVIGIDDDPETGVKELEAVRNLFAINYKAKRDDCVTHMMMNMIRDQEPYM